MTAKRFRDPARECLINVSHAYTSASLSAPRSHPSCFFSFLLRHPIYDFFYHMYPYFNFSFLKPGKVLKRTSETLRKQGSSISGLPLPVGFKLTLRISGQRLLCSEPLLSTVQGSRILIVLQKIQASAPGHRLTRTTGRHTNSVPPKSSLSMDLVIIGPNNYISSSASFTDHVLLPSSPGTFVHWLTGPL